MTDWPHIPDAAFTPERNGEAEITRTRLDTPLPFPSVWPPGSRPSIDEMIRSGDVMAGDLTPGKEVPVGQTIREETYTECFFERGSETVVLVWNTDCVVYSLLHKCQKITKVYWEYRLRDVLVSLRTTPLSAEQRQKLVCGDGTTSDITVWTPPEEVEDDRTRQLAVGHSHTVSEGGIDYLVHEEYFWKYVPPATKTGCWEIATFEMWYRIKKLRKPNLVEVYVPNSPRRVENPHQVKTESFRIPGCADTESAELRDDHPSQDINPSQSRPHSSGTVERKNK